MSSHHRACLLYLRAIILAFAALVGLARPALGDPADIAAASRSVVRVVLVRNGWLGTAMLGHGTGFVVAPDMIVTNAHVVEQARGDNSLVPGHVVIGVVPSQGQGSYPAHIVAYSPTNDLALLQLDRHAALAPLTLFPGAVPDGMQVAAVGYPGNVDAAQGLNSGDIVTPHDTVKTYGQVSAGRSSKQFDTILHTAQLGAGNSGGPLLDTCGRVVGVNSFGTVSSNGTDGSFFFAISVRELQPFLKSANVTPHLASLPCISIADLDRADRQRAADDQTRLAAQAAARLAAHDHALDTARRDAELAVLSQRDNGLAIAALLLVAAIGAGTYAYVLQQQGRAGLARVGIALTAALVIAAAFAWILRPPLGAIEERAKDRMAEIAASGTPDAATVDPVAPPVTQMAAPATGLQKLICVLNPQRSRVTVSDITDVPLEWAAGGCVNGRIQYGLAQDGWSRVLVPDTDDTIAVTHYDPATREYTVDRFATDISAMAQARAARQKISIPPCGAADPLARQFGAAQDTIRGLLPPEPIERMRYACQPAQ